MATWVGIEVAHRSHCHSLCSGQCRGGYHTGSGPQNVVPSSYNDEYARNSNKLRNGHPGTWAESVLKSLVSPCRLKS